MHETHTFLEGRTRLEDFTSYRGDEMLRSIGDTSTLAGALETGQELGWHIIPALHMLATPGAMVEDRVITTWWSEFEPIAQAALQDNLDAIYLVLHGAMVAESMLDVEGEILARIRALVGPAVLIGGVTDLHANFSERMATASDALVTYRENPHTDAKAAAVGAARVLDQLMKAGQKPVTVWEHPPLMWPPTGTATADEPMKSLEAAARRLESEDEDILAVNVHAGFSFADTPDAGVSFTAITTGDAAVARAELARLSQLAIRLKDFGNVIEPPLEDIMPAVKQLRDGPVLLVEPSDNIGGGAPGDGTAVLKALVEHHIENAAVAINDPAAVAVLSHLEPGARATLSIGGKGSTLSGEPITLEVELISRSDGKFDLEDAHSHMASMGGSHIAMGMCAVVRHAGIQILLTSNKTPPMDLGQLRSQGIIPESLFVIGVKAAVAHRRAYDPIAKVSFSIDTPGPCSSNLNTLPFRHIRRPIYPLDKI